MATYHKKTQEEEEFGRFYDENEEAFSEAARTVVSEAGGAAHAEYLEYSRCFQPIEYEMACEHMRLAAVGLTERDLELLKQLVRRLLVASVSIDPFDDDTPVGYRVYRSDLYDFYDMAARMLRVAIYAETARRESAAREPTNGFGDPSEIPF